MRAGTTGRRWPDGPVVGFDTETTGVDVATDRIVTAAVVHREGATTTVTSWLLDPGVEIPEAAAAIHGVTTGHARRFGRAPHGALDQIAQLLADALRRHEPLVAFNASFDLSILDAELRRHGLATLPERLGRPVRVVLDPLVLDRTLDRAREGRRRLADLCVQYAVRPTAPFHTADVDVCATLDVLRALAQRFPRLAETPLDVLHDRQVVAHRLWAAQHNARRAGEGHTGPDADGGWPVRASAVPVLPVLV